MYVKLEICYNLLRTGHQEVMMSPQDFLRSITPDIQQPANKGLDQFTNITKNNINLLAKDFGVEESSIFNQLGSSKLKRFYCSMWGGGSRWSFREC